MRLRLFDVLNSRLPSLVGLCPGDVVSIARFVNSAQRRLLLCREAGDEGWWGTFAEVAFNTVSRLNPYITCPREIARLERIDVCRHPVPIQNQFYEYLDFGNGRMPKRHGDNLGIKQTYTRNNAVTFSDLFGGPKIIRIYSGDVSDVQSGQRVFVGGLDSTSSQVYTQDGLGLVKGSFVSLASPFVDQPMQFSTIDSIQKDATVGPVQIFQVDPVTGAQDPLLTMEPGETVAGYRRYYLENLPCNCCHTPQFGIQPVQVTAIAKLDLIPVAVPTDYLLFSNLEAIIEECCSVRYSEMDNSGAKQMAQEKHLQAVRLLQGELVHYLGKDKPAISFKPFGSASLDRQRIGNMT